MKQAHTLHLLVGAYSGEVCQHLAESSIQRSLLSTGDS